LLATESANGNAAKPPVPLSALLAGPAKDDSDPLAPQREAAFFYGLFLRGHSLEALRQDIDIPRRVIEKWLKARDYQGAFRADLDKVYQYRKQVLAIFDGLVSNERMRLQLQ